MYILHDVHLRSIQSQLTNRPRRMGDECIGQWQRRRHGGSLYFYDILRFFHDTYRCVRLSSFQWRTSKRIRNDQNENDNLHYNNSTRPKDGEKNFIRMKKNDCFELHAFAVFGFLFDTWLSRRRIGIRDGRLPLRPPPICYPHMQRVINLKLITLYLPRARLNFRRSNVV